MRKNTIVRFLILIVVSIGTLLFILQPDSVFLNNKSQNILASYPHDNKAFTQGLFYLDGYIYEGTGLYGKSSLRKINIQTGEIVKIKKVPDIYFAEGITYLNERIYQLTWKSRTGFIYDIKTLDKIGDFNYKTHGWGLTNNSRELIYSDGSSKIYFLDPENFDVIKTLIVTDKDGKKVRNLNELEYINGKIYANIWRSDKIVSIDETTGKVLEWIDLSFLRNQISTKYKVDVLNGIAYNPDNNSIYVTGKFWPYIFEIQID